MPRPPLWVFAVPLVYFPRRRRWGAVALHSLTALSVLVFVPGLLGPGLHVYLFAWLAVLPFTWGLGIVHALCDTIPPPPPVSRASAARSKA